MSPEQYADVVVCRFVRAQGDGDEVLWTAVRDAVRDAVAAEREACAALAEDYGVDRIVGERIAAAVRKRGNP